MRSFQLFFFITFLLFTHASGAKYFQQEVKYSIHVSLNDVTHELSAYETIVYINNSDSALREIYMHLYPSAYKNMNTILAKEIFMSGDPRMLESDEKGLGYIDSLDFKVGDMDVQWNIIADTIDVCRIILNEPLRPGDSITITTPFHVKIPSDVISRLGHAGKAYYVTQWFPKPAVFDKNGWNYFPYLDQGEYYGEFGTFDVYITLPENYALAATGEMVDADKEIAWLNAKDSVTRTIKDFPEKDSAIASSKNFKTIHFHCENVHDFAWFADKRWHVLKNEIELKSGRKITTWAFFNNREAEYWVKAPQYMEDAIKYYSEWVGEYPYASFKAVDVGYATGNGMEYPTITTIGNYGDRFDLESTIVHEVGHNWFYGILGNNERRYPWMDEGVNSFFEARYVYTKHKNDSSLQEESALAADFDLNFKKRTVNHRKNQYWKYLAGARRNNDQSPGLSSDELSIPNYHGDVYFKTSISFDFLKSYLGDSMFDACMRNYYESWKFKHPQPEDLRQSFEQTSGRKLSWLFEDLLSTNKKLDYKIVCSELKDDKTVELELSNTGEIKAPVPISGIKNSSVLSTTWIEGFEGTKKLVLPCDDCDQYRIDAEERMPDLNEKNNTIRMKGIFRKTEKLKLELGFTPEDATRTQLYVAPVVGWNDYNKFMAGIVVHNISFHEKKFEYHLMPMYATRTKDLAGSGGITYHIYPKNTRFNRIAISSTLNRYAFARDSYELPPYTYSGILHFLKSDTRVTLTFPGKKRQENFINEILLRGILVNRDIPYGVYYREENRNFLYWQVEYNRKNNNPLRKSLQKINVTFTDNFFIATGEVKRFYTYGHINKGFSFRAFAGATTIPSSGSSGIDYRMNLSGKVGADDYLFDEVFLARTETSGLGSRQFVSDYAGFKTPTSYYRLAEEWMAGININTTLPGMIPFRLFLNAGSFDNADQAKTFGKISWEFGIDLPLIKDVLIIYLPIKYSDDIENAVKSQELETVDLIRFELHLNLLDPLKFIKTVYPE